MLWSRYTPLLLGLGASACGASYQLASIPPTETSAREQQSGISTPSSGKPLEAQHGPAPLDLLEFEPLLARPEFGEVRTALADGKPERAAAILKEVEAARTRTESEALQLSYSLALILEEAGDAAGAREAYRRAASQPWRLQEDALVHLARLELSAGAPERAISALAAVGTLKNEPEVLGIRAAALVQLEHFRPAAEACRLLLEREATPSGRLLYARALWGVAQAEPEGERRNGAAQEAISAAVAATVGLAEDDSLSREARGLMAEIRKGAQVDDPSGALGSEVAHVRGLFDRGDYEEAEKAALAIQLPDADSFGPQRCELDYLKAKILVSQRRWGEGADRLTAPARKCAEDPELHAAILFNAGKYAAADGRHMTAIKHYGKLEELYPGSYLADDARLRAAKSYLRVGVTARFTQMLMDMPADYPEGDMTMDGVMELALYRIERSDWSAAAQVLERGARLVRKDDSARGHEYSGRERYFWARSLGELGKEAEEFDEYESIVRELPLSYYMLHAYSRLWQQDARRAASALEESLDAAQHSPFSFPHRPEYETDEFLRGMELLKVGELEKGRQIIQRLGLEEGTDESLVWGIALLYDRAGDAHVSHRIARGKLTDWFAHYPAGDWVRPWSIGFPRPYKELVERESAATGVPEWFIYGVMREESTFDPKVVSHAGAYGLMQLILPTARGIGKPEGIPHSAAALKIPSINISLGSRVLRNLKRRFSDNPWLAIPGYNAGPGRPARWLRERPDMDFDVWVEMIPFRETQRYTKRVLASRAAYAFLYHREDAQEAMLLPERLTPP